LCELNHLREKAKNRRPFGRLLCRCDHRMAQYAFALAYGKTLPRDRQEMIARERRERQARPVWRDPHGLFNLACGRYVEVRAKVEACRVDDVARLVRCLRNEFAEILGRIGRDADAELLLKLAGERLRRAFAWLDLAARLHEGRRAALSHQQHAAGAVDNQTGSDADGGQVGVGHGFPWSIHLGCGHSLAEAGVKKGTARTPSLTLLTGRKAVERQLQPVVLPHVSHFMHVPFRTSVKFMHSPHISPS
jgi:hypothetical protein